MKRTLPFVIVMLFCLTLCACHSESSKTLDEHVEFVGTYKTTAAINISEEFAEEFLDNKISVGQYLSYNRYFQLDEDGSGLEYGDFEGHTPTQKIIVSTKRVNGMLFVDETADEELSAEVKGNILLSLKEDISWKIIDGYLCVYDSQGESLGTFEKKGNMIISVQNVNYAFEKIS